MRARRSGPGKQGSEHVFCRASVPDAFPGLPCNVAIRAVEQIQEAPPQVIAPAQHEIHQKGHELAVAPIVKRSHVAVEIGPDRLRIRVNAEPPGWAEGWPDRGVSERFCWAGRRPGFDRHRAGSAWESAGRSCLFNLLPRRTANESTSMLMRWLYTGRSSAGPKIRCTGPIRTGIRSAGQFSEPGNSPPPLGSRSSLRTPFTGSSRKAIMTAIMSVMTRQ